MIDRSLFDDMFEKISMGVFIADKDGYFKYVNPMACKMTGYKINELIGMNRMELVPDDLKDEVSAAYKEAWKDDALEEKAYYLTKSGERRYWGLKAIRLSDDMTATVTEDITEYENLIAENEKNLKKLQSAGEAGRVGSWEYNLENDTLWRSSEASRQFRGISEEDTVSLGDLKKNAIDKEIFERAVTKMLEGDKNLEFEVDIIPDNSETKRTLKIYSKIVTEKEKITGIVGTSVDITELKLAQAELENDKNTLKEYLNIAGVILLVINNAGRVIMINRRGCEILGYPEKDIIGKDWIENFIPGYLRKKIKEIHSKNVFDSDEPYLEFENPIINSQGRERLILWKNTVIKDHDGIVVGSLSSGEDVTEKRSIEKALEESEASLKKAEILTKSGHFERDLRTGKVHWSDGMCILLGYEPQVFNTSPDEYDRFMSDEARSKIEKAFHKALRGNLEFDVEVEAIRKDGSAITLEMVAVIETEGKTPVRLLTTCRDVSGSKKHMEHIEYISYHDQLTGLYNRRFLEEEFNRLDVQRNYPFAVIMADVNGLKLANDTFGHAEGDQMLKNAADVLRETVRKDDIIARIGGDEFMILLPNIEQEQVEGIMSRIMEDSKEFQTTTLPLSIALGYAAKDESGVSRDDLFKIAEDNMYRNKLHDVSSRRSQAIKIISDTLYEKNKREEAHSERVSKICVMIGAAAGLPRAELNELKTLGLMHDIGKIAVEEEFLNKASSLTQQEFENIKKHPEAGFRILSTSNDLAELADYVLAHHERWDGRGYPRALAGEEIPFQSRIIAIAEAYDAMTSKSPYSRPMAPRKAYLEIRKNAGTQFDPLLAKLFLQEVWPDLV